MALVPDQRPPIKRASPAYDAIAFLLPVPLTIVFARSLASSWASQSFGSIDAGEGFALTFGIVPGMLMLFWGVVVMTRIVAARFLHIGGLRRLLTTFLSLGISFGVTFALLR